MIRTRSLTGEHPLPRCAANRAFTAWLLAMLCASTTYAQVSPEDHARHHPGQAGGQSTTAPAGPMGGMFEMMGEMMKGMGAPAPRQLYPSLMDLPALTPQQRA